MYFFVYNNLMSGCDRNNEINGFAQLIGTHEMYGYTIYLINNKPLAVDIASDKQCIEGEIYHTGIDHLKEVHDIYRYPFDTMLNMETVKVFDRILPVSMFHVRKIEKNSILIGKSWKQFEKFLKD
jgi:gamma-glutamylcyclotransferase (GGCT)/AIG2-like uncharacterized protein YtfP